MRQEDKSKTRYKNVDKNKAQARTICERAKLEMRNTRTKAGAKNHEPRTQLKRVSMAQVTKH